MAHPIWRGSISFGLVSIPVKLHSAIRGRELHRNYLHAKDEGRVHYERVCSVDGHKVPWDQIVRGYEVDKDHYVVLRDEDFKKASPEATQSVDIVEFVKIEEIDPILFDVPYYLEPEKSGRHAYALLRDALARAGKVGIARVVLRTREHLAAVKPSGPALVLELMHWADEVVPPSELAFPDERQKLSPAEMKMRRSSSSRCPSSSKRAPFTTVTGSSSCLSSRLAPPASRRLDERSVQPRRRTWSTW